MSPGESAPARQYTAWAARSSGPSPASGPGGPDQLDQPVRADLQPHLLVRDRPAADGGEQAPIGADERDVGLGVAAIDTEDVREPSSSGRSTVRSCGVERVHPDELGAGVPQPRHDPGECLVGRVRPAVAQDDGAVAVAASRPRRWPPPAPRPSCPTSQSSAIHVPADVAVAGGRDRGEDPRIVHARPERQPEPRQRVDVRRPRGWPPRRRAGPSRCPRRSGAGTGRGSASGCATRWRLVPIRRAVSGCASTQRPCRNSVAGTSARSRASSSRSVLPGRCGRSGCSRSKVSATPPARVTSPPRR